MLCKRLFREGRARLRPYRKLRKGRSGGIAGDNREACCGVEFGVSKTLLAPPTIESCPLTRLNEAGPIERMPAMGAFEHC